MRKVLSLMAAALFLFSCKKDKDEQAQVFPLKEGNQWTYSVKDYDEDGQLVDSYTQTRVLKGTQRLNNQTYSVLLDANDNTDTLGLLRADANKVYLYDEDVSKEVVVFKWPATEGEVLFSETVLFFKVETVASAGSFTINSHESRKATLNTYFGGTKTSYVEAYIKPGLGVTGGLSYELNPATNTFYKMSEETLTSYTLK